MKITKNKKDLIIKIPLKQDSYDYAGTKICKVPNIIGVVAGERCTISQLIDLGYKGDVQEGSELIVWNDFSTGKDIEEFKKLCKELDIEVWEHTICAYCGKVIYGCHFWGNKGAMCQDCESKSLER